MPGAVADYLAAQNLPPRFVMAPHPELQALPWDERPLLEFETRRRAEATDRVSVQHGWAGGGGDRDADAALRPRRARPR